jgi:uncharacterized membrane protein YjjP (DUF1212 family)
LLRKSRYNTLAITPRERDVTIQSKDKQAIQTTLDFIDRLHSSGCPPHSVVKYTYRYAHARMQKVALDITPTKVMAVFEEPEHVTVLQKKTLPVINLRMLVETISALKQSRQAIQQHPYALWLQCLAFILIPPSYLCLVGSTLPAVGISAILGLLVWVVCRVFTDERAIIVEFVAAFLVAFIVGLLSSLDPGLPVYALCISAIVLFVPGLTVTNALESLAHNDFGSGIELLAQSLLIILKLFIGIVLGISLANTVLPHPSETHYINEVPPLLHVFGLVGISAALGVVFNARWVDIVFAFPAAIVGMWGPLYITNDWVIGTWISTMIITCYGLVMGKVRQVPPLVYIMQGIIILVPGSRILVGASESFFSQAILPIPNIGLSAVLMFCAIVAGQIISYSLYITLFKKKSTDSSSYWIQ